MTNERTPDGQTVIIYNNRKPDLLRYGDLYSPNKPTGGKVIPDIDSVVVKPDNTLWRVSDVDKETGEFTLVPINYVSKDDEANKVYIVSYNNDKFRAYVDTRTEPHRIEIDRKLLFYGTSLTEYTLSRLNEHGDEELISAYYDNTGSYKSDRIPLTSISQEHIAYKYPTNCHTIVELEDDEPLTLRVYNNLGVISAEITVYVRYAAWFNDLQSHTNPIVEFGVRCLQEQGDDFYIFTKQDPDELNIMPYVVYSDGTRMDVPVDRMKCFMYGFEDFVPDYPGRVQTLIFKYFLNRKEAAIVPHKANFLVCTKQLKVVSNFVDFEVKVSPIPIFDGKKNEWYLRFFAYTTKRKTCHDITNLVSYLEGKAFDGSVTKWGKEQAVEIKFDLQSIFNNDDTLPGAQSFMITVKDPKTYDRYVMREDDTSDHYYGTDSSLTRRPVLYKDREQQLYFIPTSVFGKVEDMIESFYTLADPLYNTVAELGPPTPTHFTLRDASSGRMMISSIIPIENYFKAMTLLTGLSLKDRQVVIVEFLKEVESGNPLILYGVPVDVSEGYTYQGYERK